MFFLWAICPGFSFLWCATFCSSFCFCSLPSKRVRCSIHVEVVVKSCKQIWKRNEKLRTKNCWKAKSKTPRDRCRTHLRCDSYSCILCVLSECRCLCKGHMSMNKPNQRRKTCLYDYLHYMPKTDCIKLSSATGNPPQQTIRKQEALARTRSWNKNGRSLPS